MTSAPLVVTGEQRRALATLCAGNRSVMGVVQQVAVRQRTSLEWHARSLESASAGRSQLPYFSPVLPLCVARAQGGRIACVDGHDYVDVHMGYTAGILGHNPPQVVAGVAAALGSTPGAGYFVPAQVELAELVQQLVPGAERAAFLHAGADAVLAAVRLCRARTRRSVIAKFEGCYHGWHEPGLVNTAPTWAGRMAQGPLHAIAPELATAGMNRLHGDEFLILPYGDPLALQLIRDHAHELAGVLLDPVPRFMMNDLDGAAQFARQVRAVTQELEVPLIADEVVTGFRLAPGGIAQAFGVEADLHCFGKITGGLGLPISLVAGRAELMTQASTAGLLDDYVSSRVWISTTTAGNALSVTAALHQLRAIQAGGETLFCAIDAHHQRIRAAVNAVATDLGLPVTVDGHPRLYSMLSVNVDPPDPTGLSAADAANPARAYFRRFTLGNVRAARLLTLYLRLQGVYAEGLPTVDLSAAHSTADTDQIIHGLRESLTSMQAHGAFA
ncbi:aminotransferase class III-fold pyridoxal phosphate-dependent enzyme [Deinococcus sp. KSM4-11]|uniref:aminotransferase class III-fold pyridoxal phosphate-dependent enzyme n=1 Tax=Deinococcus sp. KSM4-11 TaxID=2568654 RepID=UPI0010A4E6BB|nr:aminotransferase class III-fold pyridoxal phosphate-dependent enzyme [Deinococcus sp. KSM4-11]THF85588.1 aminotransferase class III-fold pyridoxal phosphate-dependent enzyme [Deinococcus sp. KSM4-11]